jgi:hypothetical protein
MTSVRTFVFVVALMASAGAQGLVSGQLKPRGASGVLPTGVVKLTSPAGQDSDQFGGQVSLSGSRVAVGATGQDGAGAVFVYEVGPLPVFHSKIVAPDGIDGDAFGSAVALRGSTLAVGAGFHDAGAVDDGAVWVFDVP